MIAMGAKKLLQRIIGAGQLGNGLPAHAYARYPEETSSEAHEPRLHQSVKIPIRQAHEFRMRARVEGDLLVFGQPLGDKHLHPIEIAKGGHCPVRDHRVATRDRRWAWVWASLALSQFPLDLVLSLRYKRPSI